MLYKSLRSLPRNGSIQPRQAKPVHALEIVRIGRLALAKNHQPSLFRQPDGQPADRLHQRSPLIGMVAGDRAGDIRRADCLFCRRGRGKPEQALFENGKIRRESRCGSRRGWELCRLGHALEVTCSAPPVKTRARPETSSWGSVAV